MWLSKKVWSIIHFSSRSLEPSMKYSLVEDHCDKTFVPNFAQNKNIILPVQFAFPIDFFVSRSPRDEQMNIDQPAK